MSSDYTVTDLESFTGDVRKVGVGYKITGDDAAFDDGNIAVTAGDVAVMSDPDAGNHASGCELVMSEETAAFVTGFYAVDYGGDGDGYAVELNTTEFGRVPINDRHVGIVTETGVVGGMSESGARYMASRLVDHDEYEKYYRMTAHLGENGVPDGLWEEYEGSGNSGPDCSVCTGEKGQDGTVIEGR